MKRLLSGMLFLIAALSHTSAENPMIRGIRNTLTILSPPPSEAPFMALTQTAGLASYTGPRRAPEAPLGPIPANRNIADPPSRSESLTWKTKLILAVLFMGVASLLVTLDQMRGKRLGRRRGPQAPASPSPPLPAGDFAPPSDSIDLIRRKDTLLTSAELAFFSVLEPIVRPSFNVSAKVRLADVFEAPPGHQAAFNKVSGKHIDFVLTDPQSSRILCGIELDDSTHDRPDRMKRDRFVNRIFGANQLPLLRIPCAPSYLPEMLRAELEQAGLVLSSAA